MNNEQQYWDCLSVEGEGGGEGGGGEGCWACAGRPATPPPPPLPPPPPRPQVRHRRLHLLLLSFPFVSCVANVIFLGADSAFSFCVSVCVLCNIPTPQAPIPITTHRKPKNKRVLAPFPKPTNLTTLFTLLGRTRRELYFSHTMR